LLYSILMLVVNIKENCGLGEIPDLLFVCVIVFNVTFNNISAISWQ
jgi:hypothetical protein